MRAYRLPLVVLAALWPGDGRSQEPVSDPDVLVYVTGVNLVPRPVNLRAQAIASAIFARINVRITWLESMPRPAQGSGNPVVIHVQYVRRAADDCSREALAYSQLLSKAGKEISVLVEQVRMTAAPFHFEQVLGHVLAHEIAHSLASASYHSKTGVMKAVWDRTDFMAMGRAPLDFTNLDVILIRRGLAARVATLPRNPSGL